MVAKRDGDDQMNPRNYLLLSIFSERMSVTC